MTSELFTVQLTTEQKDLFDKWLSQEERELESKLASIKSLRENARSVASKSQNLTIPPKQVNKIKSRGQSWTSKTSKALQYLKGSQTSTQVIDWLIENDPDLKDQSRRQVTKNVTSKLSLLVDKGRVVKETVDGKNIYSLK